MILNQIKQKSMDEKKNEDFELNFKKLNPWKKKLGF